MSESTPEPDAPADDGGDLPDDDLGGDLNDGSDQEDLESEPGTGGEDDPTSDDGLPPMPDDYGLTDPLTGKPGTLSEQERRDTWARAHGYQSDADAKRAQWQDGVNRDKTPSGGGGGAGAGGGKRKQPQASGQQKRSWFSSLFTFNLTVNRNKSKTSNVTGIQFGGGKSPGGSSGPSRNRRASRARRRSRR